MSVYLWVALLPLTVSLLAVLYAMSRPNVPHYSRHVDGAHIVIEHDAGTSVYWACDGTRAKDRRPS